MKTYFIKKQIQANTVIDAIKNEKKAELTDIWIEDKKDELPSVVGFTASADISDDN